MSDDAPITSRSGSTGPAYDHRSVLIAADRRRRTIPVKALPLVPRAVWVALAGRANEHGIAWPTIDTLAADAGTFTSTVRRALDWLIAKGWVTVVEPGSPRASARLRVNLEPVPPAGVAERYPLKPRRRGSGALSEGARSEHPGVAERVIRGSGASTEDHRKDHRKDHKEDPSYAPPRVAADGSGQALLFRPVDHPEDVPPPPPAAEEPPPKRRRAAKDPAAPKVPTAAERYAAAYVAGFAAEGHTITPPTKSEAELIGRVCATHARYTDGSPITGEALERWIRKQARRFVSNVDGTRHAGGYGAFGFRRFCDDNPPDRPRPPGEVPPAPPAPPERPVYTPEQQAMADRFVRMGRGERVPAGVPGG
jgi:hypothetical protein